VHGIRSLGQLDAAVATDAEVPAAGPDVDAAIAQRLSVPRQDDGQR
jgi:hypothetical protein